MGRRYRRGRSNSIVSVVSDVVHIASRLPWWGALLTGFISSVLIAVVLGGYIEGQIASQAGSRFYTVIDARYGRLVNVCHWVGMACFLVGVFFAIRNYCMSTPAGRNEQGFVAFLSKLIGRNID